MKNTKRINDIIGFVSAGNKRFVMDDYQRDYTWKKDNWDAFLGTINKVGRFTEYVGNFIYFIDDETKLSYDIKMVDGQQRLTTHSICLAVIRDLLKEKKSEIDENADKTISIINQLLYKLTFNGRYTFLQFNNTSDTNNQKDYECIAFGEDKSSCQTQIFKAYKYIKNYFNKFTLYELCDFCEKKLNNIGVVELICESDEEAHKVFSSQSLGVPLTNNDQIKAKIINIIKNNNLSDEKRSELIKEIKNIVKQINRTFFNRFYYNETDKWVGKDILRIFSSWLDENNDIKTINKIIDFYKQEQKYTTTKIYTHPSLLVLYNDLIKYNVPQKIYDIIYNTLQNIVIRTNIHSKGSSTTIHEQTLANLVKKMKDSGLLDSDTCNIKNTITNMVKENKLNVNKELFIISDDILLEDLLTYNLFGAKNNLAKYCLLELNKFINNEMDCLEQLTLNDATIDHIQAQNDKSNIVNTLGNLTLLGRKPNSRKGCCADYSEIRKSGLPINKFLSTYLTENKEYWSDDDIEQYTKTLGEKLIQII